VLTYTAIQCHFVSICRQCERADRLPVYNEHDDVCGASIESSRRFVKEQDGWRRYEFHANVDAFAFTAGYSADKLVTDLYIFDSNSTSDA